MSTKIYTGFRLATSSWPEIHGHVMAFRHDLESIAYRERCRRVAGLATQYIDRVAVGLKEHASDCPYATAYMEVMDDQRKDPAEFSVVLIPHEGTIYGMTFGERFAEEAWFARPFVEKWGYWNNTDRPDDLTDAEWEHRARTWDALLGDDPPNMRGFSAECIPKYGRMPTPEDVVPLVPPMDKRVSGMAVETLFPEFSGANEGESIHQFGRFMTWIGGDGAGRFAGEVERVRGLLAAEVTKDMLTGVKL